MRSLLRELILVQTDSCTHSLIDEGGDWDRRNRLKVYTGLHLLTLRQFKRGGELLCDALSTFTATELLPYNDFVALTVVANALSLGRVELKKKVCSFRRFYVERRLGVLTDDSRSSTPQR